MTPERGQIWHLEFDPSSGREMTVPHFCLVVSPREFHIKFKMALACPISGGESAVARSAGFLVSLMGMGLKTDGQVHVHQVKSLDFGARNAKFVEAVPDTLMNEVLDCLRGVFE